VVCGATFLEGRTLDVNGVDVGRRLEKLGEKLSKEIFCSQLVRALEERRVELNYGLDGIRTSGET
jgi:hypothetical protein